MSSIDNQFIGIANMTKDGTLMLKLRATSNDGAEGESLLIYSKEDDDYESIINHLGKIKPGETKLVPPWNNL